LLRSKLAMTLSISGLVLGGLPVSVATAQPAPTASGPNTPVDVAPSRPLNGPVGKPHRVAGQAANASASPAVADAQRVVGDGPDPVTNTRLMREVPHSIPPHALAVHAATDPAVPNPTVGRLWHSGLTEKCTAAVLPGTHHNMIITAGHCVYPGNGGEHFSDLLFAPGYSPTAPHFPFGTFKAKDTWTLAGWKNEGKEWYDVAIVVLEPNELGKNVGDAVGGWNGFTTGQPQIAYRTVWGYQADDRQLECFGTTTPVDLPPDDRLLIKCGYDHGASGGPWLKDYNSTTHLGMINGDNATGGATAVTSPYFGDAEWNLWVAADKES
jgi:V8-like Glu-specific endopeptidase